MSARIETYWNFHAPATIPSLGLRASRAHTHGRVRAVAASTHNLASLHCAETSAISRAPKYTAVPAWSIGCAPAFHRSASDLLPRGDEHRDMWGTMKSLQAYHKCELSVCIKMKHTFDCHRGPRYRTHVATRIHHVPIECACATASGSGGDEW